ncbi:MAG: LPS export ABC transporter periplasmic protein LptC [Pseudomonadota bacterium]
MLNDKPKDRHSGHAARRVSRHTMRVRNLRLAVPALAAGLLITYAASATPPRVDRSFIMQFSSFDMSEDEVKLARPRYSGEDLSGRPFEVAANAAVRANHDPDLVGLDYPEARRLGDTGAAILVRAEDGLYDRRNRLMDLTRNVELEQEGDRDHFILKTDAAAINLDSQVVTSSAEVHGAGDTGTVRADRATVYQTEDRLVLEGDVKIRLEPRKPAKE